MERSANPPIWCGACQDNFDVDHYGEGGMIHKTGAEFGPTGEERAERAALKAEVDRLWGMVEEIQGEVNDESESAEERLAMVRAIVRDALLDS